MCACWGRLLSVGMRARLLIHACETTVTPAHDEPLEEQAARAQTDSGYARNGTLFPQVYRAAAPPVASKKFAFHGFFSCPWHLYLLCPVCHLCHQRILGPPSTDGPRSFHGRWHEGSEREDDRCRRVHGKRRSDKVSEHTEVP